MAASVEFWGIEVKGGQSVKIKMEADKFLHLSHATLGESKSDKGNEAIPLFLKIDDQKLVLGRLSSVNTHLNFDLVFEKDFELSHNWKNASVCFMGYKTVATEDSESASESDDDVPLHMENGKPDIKVAPEKPAKAAVKSETADKPKGKHEDIKRKNKDDEDQDDDVDDLDDSDDEDDLKMGDAEDGSEEDGEDDSEEEDSDDDDDAPKKVEAGKRALGESAMKTPVPAKKAKFTSPQKTDIKTVVHTATPHPSKQHPGKGDAQSGGNKNAQTPKSSAPSKHTCATCKKVFGSEMGLQSHSKAKHGAK